MYYLVLLVPRRYKLSFQYLELKGGHFYNFDNFNVLCKILNFVNRKATLVVDTPPEYLQGVGGVSGGLPPCRGGVIRWLPPAGSTLSTVLCS